MRKFSRPALARGDCSASVPFSPYDEIPQHIERDAALSGAFQPV